MAALSLKNVSKKYGEIQALSNISLEVPDGELFFLIGPSGCGKSTLLRLIAGLDSPDTGDIAFEDKFITHLPSEKRNVSMVFQNYALWPHLTVFENVAFGLEVRKLSKQEITSRVQEVLDVVRILDLQYRHPHELSGGQQQRVGLARALAFNPSVLLLDEPLSNLDAKLKSEMTEEFFELHKRLKQTTIYVSHDHAECLPIAERIAVMNSGRLEQIGTPIELYKKPVSRFVSEFLGETNLIEGEVVSVDANTHVATSIGTLMVAGHSAKITVHMRVLVTIRPEDIVLKDSSTNSFPCTVRDLRFYGQTSRFLAEISPGSSFTCVILGCSADIRMGISTKITLPPEALKILRQ